MKKRALVALLFVLSPATLFAQDTTESSTATTVNTNNNTTTNYTGTTTSTNTNTNNNTNTNVNTNVNTSTSTNTNTNNNTNVNNTTYTGTSTNTNLNTNNTNVNSVSNNTNTNNNNTTYTGTTNNNNVNVNTNNSVSNNTNNNYSESNSNNTNNNNNNNYSESVSDSNVNSNSTSKNENTNTNINKNETVQKIEQDIKSPPPSAIAPSIGSSFSQDLCTTGVGGAVQTQLFGISGGGSVRDMNCERIKLSKTMYDMGMKVAAVSLMCQDERVWEAMRMAGTPCPFEGAIGTKALDAWKENPDRAPEGVKVTHPKKEVKGKQVDYTVYNKKEFCAEYPREAICE